MAKETMTVRLDPDLIKRLDHVAMLYNRASQVAGVPTGEPLAMTRSTALRAALRTGLDVMEKALSKKAGR